MVGADDRRDAVDAFVARLAALGLAVPPDRVGGAFAVHEELTAMAALLRQPRGPDSEPANVFVLDALLPEP